MINIMQLFQVFVTISSNCMEVDLLPHVLRVIFKKRREKSFFQDKSKNIVFLKKINPIKIPNCSFVAKRMGPYEFYISYEMV